MGCGQRLDVVPAGDHTGNAGAVVASLLADVEILRNLERALATVASVVRPDRAGLPACRGSDGRPGVGRRPRTAHPGPP